jgi:hypothetical protein
MERYGLERADAVEGGFARASSSPSPRGGAGWRDRLDAIAHGWGG